MNAEEFIDGIKIAVEKSTIENILDELAIEPDVSELKAKILYDWYQNLDALGKGMVKLLITNTTQTSIFGFLCVLDGVRAIEDTTDKGELQLYFVKDEEQTLLNDFSEDFLHDIYNS